LTRVSVLAELPGLKTEEDAYDEVLELPG